MKHILIAGIGNVLHGDDAFGCEVVRQLQKCALPHAVTLADFGIRIHDLAHALNDGYESIILVDAAPRGKEPGTLYLLEPDTHQTALIATQMARSCDGTPGKLYVVGYEPELLDNDMGEIGLSLRAQQMIPQALAMVESLLVSLVMEDDEHFADLAPV